MDWLRALFTDTNAVAHIILVYALVVALGTLLGRLKVAGISLGVTFVLFVGLAAGHFGLTVPEPVLFFIRDFGLTLFIFFGIVQFIIHKSALLFSLFTLYSANKLEFISSN